MYSSNQALLAASLQYVWHPCTQMKHHEQLPLIPIRSGQGAWLIDMDGQRYLDGISSWWVNLFGHANPRISQAIKQQLDQLEHVMLAGFTHEPVVTLSERLSQMTGGVLGHAFYGSDGASCIEIALKMSFHAWRNQGHTNKCEFVCLKNSYHGETLGALSVTDVALFREAYGPLLNQVHIVAGADSREADSVNHALQRMQILFEERHQLIAALIVEPLVQCAAGMVMSDPAYLKGLRDLCDRYQIHLIADEVAVGCGRTGTFFACEQAGIWPDLLCLSKGISGGYLPLSLVLSRESIYQSFYDDQMARGFLHSHSYTGNPLACAAAVATLNIFAEDQVLLRNQGLAAQISQQLHAVKAHPAVRNFRQQGMIWAFEVATDLPDFARQFFSAALQHGLLLRPIGKTVYLMPPYILNEAEVSHLTQATLQTLNEVSKP